MTQDSILIIFGGAVMTTLCGVVGYLFSDFRATKLKVESELKECQEDRLRLWKEIHLIQKHERDSNR